MNTYLTSRENLALSLIFEHMGEERINRTAKEYEAIASALPVIKQLHGYVNNLLRETRVGSAPHQICHFKAGDRYPRYEDYPTSISIETIRSALVKSGMRRAASRKPRTR